MGSTASAEADKKGAKETVRESDKTSVHCKICKVSFSNKENYLVHTRGVLHTQNLREGKAEAEDDGQVGETKTGQEDSMNQEKEKKEEENKEAEMGEKGNPEDPDKIPPREKKTFYCEICNIYCTCEVNMEMHKAGKKHLFILGKRNSKQFGHGKTHYPKREWDSGSEYETPAKLQRQSMSPYSDRQSRDREHDPQLQASQSREPEDASASENSRDSAHASVRDRPREGYSRHPDYAERGPDAYSKYPRYDEPRPGAYARYPDYPRRADYAEARYPDRYWDYPDPRAVDYARYPGYADPRPPPPPPPAPPAHPRYPEDHRYDYYRAPPPVAPHARPEREPEESVDDRLAKVREFLEKVEDKDSVPMEHPVPRQATPPRQYRDSQSSVETLKDRPSDVSYYASRQPEDRPYSSREHEERPHPSREHADQPFSIHEHGDRSHSSHRHDDRPYSSREREDRLYSSREHEDRSRSSREHDDRSHSTRRHEDWPHSSSHADSRRHSAGSDDSRHHSSSRSESKSHSGTLADIIAQFSKAPEKDSSPSYLAEARSQAASMTEARSQTQSAQLSNASALVKMFNELPTSVKREIRTDMACQDNARDSDTVSSILSRLSSTSALSLIRTEEEARLALEVSKSLTDSLLMFRMKSNPAEVRKAVEEGVLPPVSASRDKPSPRQGKPDWGDLLSRTGPSSSPSSSHPRASTALFATASASPILRDQPSSLNRAWNPSTKDSGASSSSAHSSDRRTDAALRKSQTASASQRPAPSASQNSTSTAAASSESLIYRPRVKRPSTFI